MYVAVHYFVLLYYLCIDNLSAIRNAIILQKQYTTIATVSGHSVDSTVDHIYC